ncbi:centriole and centriolar satellite protein OFD1 [Rhinophrynus dorsalis]
MASSEFKSLSHEELRKRLYQTFKNKGVLDLLKTQLRNQLIHELKHSAFSGEPASLSEDVCAESLLLKVSNSMVADHLRRCGYEYTLSVFFPECGLEKEKVLTVHDLLQLMKISPKSGLYKSLTSSPQNGNAKGFLFQMLTEVMEYHLHRDGRDADTQTVTSSPYKDSIVEKLKFIDEQFEEIYPKRTKFESLESKLSDYRREMEEQLRAEMSQKFQHFKDVEIAKIKLEEREKSQREVSDLRREFEKTYQTKSEGLVSREKSAIERLQRQQEIETKEIYLQRQTLLKDIEVVRSRETELRQKMEAFELAQKLQEEKNRSVNESLRRRELEVKNIEDTFDQKLKNELLQHQIELKEEYLKRTQKVSEDEIRNKETAARLREEAIAINLKKQELEQAVSRTRDLEIEVDSLKAQLSLLTRQNHLLTDKLKETADYPLVQEEKTELQKQTNLLKQQLEETRKENQILRERTAHPSAECVVLQEELKRMEGARKFDQDEFKSQRKILEKKLQHEVERCAELKAKLLHSEDSARRSSVQVEHLEFQLRQTQLALENEVYRNPKPSLVDRSVLDFTSNKMVPPDIYVEKAAMKSHLPLESHLETSGISGSQYRYLTRTQSSSPDSDLEFVANTKARIKELEKEAEYLDEAYRNYQNRLIRAATVNGSPLVTIPTRRPHLNTVLAAPQHKVTFLEDNLTPEQHILLSKLKTQGSEEVMSSGTDITLRTKISSSRRLSSTPISKSDGNFTNRGKVLVEDHDGSYIASSPQSPKQRLSPIPNLEVVSTLSCDVPDIPLEPEKEHESSCHQPAAVSCDVTDNSRPQKLSLEDLDHSDASLQDQEDIPEQLESDFSHPYEDLVLENCVTANIPTVITPQLHSISGPDVAGGRNIEQMDKESKRMDIKEDSEEQQKESDSLQKAKDQRKNEMSESQKSEMEGEVPEENVEVNHPEDGSSSTKASVNPLDKYMQMILQNKTEETSKKVTKEPLEEVSVVETISNESLTALSHGEGDEDFW